MAGQEKPTPRVPARFDRKTPLIYIPPKVRTPDRHYTLTVRLLNPNQMQKKYGEYYDGMLDAPNRHIDINRKMPLKRKWWVFAQIWRQVISEYWLPWLIEDGIALENPPDKRLGAAARARINAWERSRWPRRKLQRQQAELQRLNAGRIPDQTSDSEGVEAVTQGSSPSD